MNGESGSRRTCGCHAQAKPSCCREACAPARASRKCVVANGIVLSPETSYDRAAEQTPLVAKLRRGRAEPTWRIRLLVRTRAVAAHVYLVELVSRSRMPASGHRPSLLPARTRRGPSMLRVRSEVAE